MPVLAAILAWCFLLPTLTADSRRDDPSAQVGVARVTAVDGDVQTLRRNGDRESALAGGALYPGDVLIAGRSSRAEAELDFGNFVRIGAESELRLVSLGRRWFRLDLLRGVASVTQMKRAEADLSIETPLAAVSLLKPGELTIEHRPISPAGRTDVLVRDGQAEVFVAGRSTIVKKDRLTVIGEAASGASLETGDAGDRSELEGWARRRNKTLDPRRGFGMPFPPYYWSPWNVMLAVGYGWGGRF